jgi:thimet oligopeptidase
MDSLHLWNGPATGEAAKEWTDWHLAQARAKIAALLAVDGPRTVDNTLKPFDQAQWHLRIAGSQTGVMFMVHPASALRDAVQELSQAVSAEGVALSLNQDVYRALGAVDASTEDAATQYYLERTLLGYRLAGVDRDEAVRNKVGELAERMTELSLSFSRAVQDDVRQVHAKASELAGLPEDYVARKPAVDGMVAITTDPPDMAPVMNYAKSRELRRNMYLAYNDRAYPKNKETLLSLLALREEMAELLGFRSWADLATVDQMMGSAGNMRKFLGEVEEAASDAAHKEFGELEAFVREQDAAALPLTLSDARFWEEEFRRARYDFDSQSVRPYFPYAQVEKGIRDIAAQLFQLRFEAASDAPVWDAAVQAFDVIDDDQASAKQGSVIGRIYLDMHPREGKSKWFSECSLIGGVLGEQVPEASLVCNFPQPTAGDQGLMQYSDVVTYFHEFGHLMHEVLGGQQRWNGQSGIATEGDFVEVPSQMLEEFFENADMLRTFARHYETGEPIPYETVERMTRAASHGRALSTLTQVMYATYSMETHDQAAGKLDLDALLREGYDRFSKYEFVDGNRMYAAFTHLVGYTSNYYTYLYDKAIALEFFAAFRGQHSGPDAPPSAATVLFDAATARRYRQQVLAPGGSKPARQLVRDFLGHDTDTTALREWVRKAVA